MYMHENNIVMYFTYLTCLTINFNIKVEIGINIGFIIMCSIFYMYTLLERV